MTTRGGSVIMSDMATKTYRIPPAFWYDHHVNRGCSESAIVERETKTYVLVTLDQAAFDDLRSDCAFTIEQSAAGSWACDMGGLTRSAKATLKHLDRDPLGDGAARTTWTFDGGRFGTVTVTAPDEHTARVYAECKTYGAGKWNLVPQPPN